MTKDTMISTASMHQMVLRVPTVVRWDCRHSIGTSRLGAFIAASIFVLLGAISGEPIGNSVDNNNEWPPSRHVLSFGLPYY